MTTVLARVFLAALAASTSMACVELITRYVDGYSVTSWPLARTGAPKTLVNDTAAAYVHEQPVAPGVDRSWFTVDPSQPTGGNERPDVELVERSSSHGEFGLSSMYEWNLRYLRDAACAPESSRYKNVISTVFPVGDLFVFEPLGHSPYPRYRFLRNARYPSGLTTNAFGWRGPDLALNKPAKTIRIAFVGASTTAAPHAARYSYPDYIRTWLARWRTARHLPVDFEIVNAAREGIDSSSIAAIVRDELTPLEPDIVVYYEGANQFGPADFVRWPDGIVLDRPPQGAPWALESKSAVVRRLRSLRDPFGRSRHEPPKPRLPVAWPADLSEDDPQLDHARLPLELPNILGDFDRMRAALAGHGGRLAICSFVWCVQDGLQLDPVANAGVYRYLNEMFWPFSYAYMRRLADFQNRAFAKYARAHHLDFIDIAGQYPLDPGLFEDAIHMTSSGIRLMAWISFQKLVPILERSIAAGVLPQASRQHLSRHPDFAGAPRTLMSVSAIRASCSAP